MTKGRFFLLIENDIEILKYKLTPNNHIKGKRKVQSLLGIIGLIKMVLKNKRNSVMMMMSLIVCLTAGNKVECQSNREKN